MTPVRGDDERVGLRSRALAPLGVVVRETFLDEGTLDAVRQAMAAGDAEPAAVRAADTADLTTDTTARIAWEVSLPDNLHDAIVQRINALRPALEAVCRRVLEPCNAVAALRYPRGAFYGPHRDVAVTPGPDGLNRREVSVVIFVNDGGGPRPAFGGGCLRLYGLRDEEGLDLVPEAGTLVAFPSRLRHEVTPVTWGERYTVVTWLLEEEGPRQKAQGTRQET